MTYPVGTRLVRTNLEGDAWDAIKVAGVFDMGELGSELAVTPADTFGPVTTVQPDGLHGYVPQAAEVAALDKLRQRLDAWEFES